MQFKFEKMLRFKQSYKICLLFICAFSIQAVAGEAEEVYSSTVRTVPPEVSATGTRLELHVQSPSALPARAIIELTLPDDTVGAGRGGSGFTAAALASKPRCEVSGTAAPDPIACVVTKDVITWTLSAPVARSSAIALIVHDAFKNPISAEATSSFVMRIYTDSTKSQAMDYQQADLGLTATPGQLTPERSQLVQLAAKDGGTGEVSKPTKVLFRCLSKNPLPKNAIIIIDIPQFNPQAPRTLRRSYFVDMAKTSCSKVESVAAGLSCKVATVTIGNEAFERLTISGALPAGLAAEKEMVLQIDSLLNPLSMHERRFTTALAVVGKDGKVHDVVRGDTAFSATAPTTISKVEILAADVTVQEYTEFTINFTPDVEVEAGAYVMIDFPSTTDGLAAFEFDENLNSMTTIGGIFGGRTDNAAFAMDRKSRKVETKDPTPQRVGPRQATVVLSKIKNPSHVGAFGSFGIYVYDKYKALVAQVDVEESASFYKTAAGSIFGVSIGPQNPAVDVQSMLTLEFYPLHRLPTAAKLKIEISGQLKIECPGANGKDLDFEHNAKLLRKPLKVGCSSPNSGNNKSGLSIFDIDGPFKADYYHDDPVAAAAGVADPSKLIKIVFMQSRNPLSAMDIRGLKISTLTAAGKLVDVYDAGATVLFTVVPSPFYKAAVVAEQTETSTASAFTFTFTLANTVLAGGTIELVAPPELQLPASQAAVTIKPIKNMDTVHTSASAAVDPAGKVLIVIRDFISQATARLSAADEISFELRDLVTPKTTVSSRSFKVYTKDKAAHLINYIESDLFVTMFKGKAISTLVLTSSSAVVGALASHTFSFQTPIPLTSSDQLLIVYPAETYPPLQSNQCAGGKSFGSQIDCTVIQNIVKTPNLVFNAAGGGVPTGTMLSFTVKNSQNPKSMKPTGVYKFYIKDGNGDVISEMTSANFAGSSLTMKAPSPIQVFKFDALDNRQLAHTAFELSFTSTMPYPAGSYLHLVIDSAVIGPEDAASRAKVKCSSNLQLQAKCTFLQDLQQQANKIKVEGIFIDDVLAKTHVSFMITDFYINIKDPMVTDSWVLTVYTSESYAIDQIKSGLSLKFVCTAPCLTCVANGPTVADSKRCTSCNTITKDIILYKETCIERCPAKTFYDDSTYGCKDCNSNCLECNYENGNECTSCDPKGVAPYLDGVVCKATCPFGTYADRDLHKCMPCQAPCQSCNSGPLDCNTCDFKSEKRYFEAGKCLTGCDPGYTVPLDRTDFLCVECSSNCETCAIDPKNCLTCKPKGAAFLSLADNTCHEACPAGITVGKPGVDKHCQICTGKCQTCDGKPDFCTSCAKEFSLDESAGECVRDCAESKQGKKVIKHQTRVALDGKCVNCASPCATCETTKDYCLTCEAGLVMHEYKCLQQCPEKYEAKDGKCVLTGFFCGFGYTMRGNACFLTAQICEGNDTLNYDKTKCIPQPGLLIPFPLLILAFIGAIVIIFDKRKHPKSRFFPNMICILSVLETIGLICLVSLSSQYGIRPSYSLSACALMFLYGMNLFFSLVYFKQIKADIVFKYWEQEYQMSSLYIVSIGSLCNFKFFRMFYSRYQDKKNYNAPFQDEQTYYRTLVFTSAFFVITGTVPIIVASCFGLWYIRFGYQVQMFCIEMLIIEILLLILQSIELFKIRKYYLSKSIYKIRPKEHEEFVRADVVGMSEEEDPEENETVTLLKKLIQRMNVKDAGKRQGYGTIQEIQDLHDEEFRQHQMRRCISFKEIREYQNEHDEFQAMINEEDSDDDRAFNYISEPSSPRSKEMLLNPNFHCRMNELSKAYCMRDQYDNCYHEAKPLYMLAYVNSKMVSRTVQTNVLELLGVDDLLPQDSKNFEEIEKRNLHNEKIDEESVNENEFLEEAANEMGSDLVNNVLQNFEGFQEKKKRKRLAPARMRQLPKFAVTDLIGKFDIDEEGNYIIISNGRDGGGRDILEDQTGKRVNRRGYFIDDDGQIITRDGAAIFRIDEVDEDDEIPAPFCYQKNKESLGLKADGAQNLFGPNGMATTFDSHAVVQELEDEDELVDQEYQKLYKMDQGDRSQRSADSQDQAHQAAAMAPSKMIKNVAGVQQLYNPNDEDLIEKISQPMRPKPRGQLIPKREKSPTQGNKPPRFGVADNLSKIKIDNDNNTSIEADFLLRGNLGVLNDMSEKSPHGFMKSDKSPQRQTHLSSNADIFNVGGQTGNLEDIHVEISKRPCTGNTGGRSQAKNRRRKRQPGQTMSADKPARESTARPRKPDHEQDILDGIEKFQAMLSRYPLKPMAGKASNTLANKNLSKVYGKIKKQFSKNINLPEHFEPNAGGTQTPSQFRYAGSRSGLRNHGSIIESVHSQSSVHGNATINSNNGPKLGASNTLTQHAKAGAGRPNAGMPLSANDRVRGLTQIYKNDFRNKASGGRTVVSQPGAKVGVLSMAKLHSELNDATRGNAALGSAQRGELEGYGPDEASLRSDGPYGLASAHGGAAQLASGAPNEAAALLHHQSSASHNASGSLERSKPAPGKPGAGLLSGGYL